MGYGGAAAFFGRLFRGLRLQREQPSMSSVVTSLAGRSGKTELKMNLRIIQTEAIKPGGATIIFNPVDLDKMKKKLEDEHGVDNLSNEGFIKQLYGDDKRDGKSTQESGDDEAEKLCKIVKKIDTLMSDNGEKSISG